MLSSLLKINNSIFLILAVCSGCLVSHSSLATEFETLYQMSKLSSTELKKANASSDEALALLNASHSSFFPRLGVESRYETFDSKFESVKGGTASAFLEWNVFRGFKDFQNRKSLLVESKAAQAEKNRFELNFKWILAAKYAKAQALQKNVKAFNEAIKANQKNLQTLNLRKASGRLSEADYLEFQLFDSQLKQRLVQLETEASESLADLSAFSGTNVRLGELTTELAITALNLEGLNFSELLNSDSSLLAKYRLSTESADFRKRLTTGGFLPEVNVKASYGSLGLRETVVSPETALAVTAKWEIFSGFETINDRKVAHAKLVRAQAELESQKIFSLSRAEQLREIIKATQVRYEFEKKNKLNLERYLRVVEDEYRRGVKSSTDLKSALELTLETQIDRSQLAAVYFQARAELQDIIGKELK